MTYLIKILDFVSTILKRITKLKGAERFLYKRILISGMIKEKFKHKLFKLIRAYDIMVIGPLTIYHDHKKVREFYNDIVESCNKKGYIAYNAHKFTDPYKHPNINPREVYNIDKKLVSGARLVVAYVGSPSTGTGQELEIAEDNHVPIILVYEKNKKISRMVLGNPSVIKKVLFTTFQEAIPKIQKAVEFYFEKIA